MRRILCLLLACTLLFSFMLTVYATEEDTEVTEPGTSTEPTDPVDPDDGLQKMSQDGIDMIKKFEGFAKKPYWDVSQWSVGYGTSCPSDKLDEYKQNGITEEEAEALLLERLKSYEKAVRYFSEKQDRPLEQHEFDALVCFTYNLGSGWVYKNSNFRRVMANENSTEAEIIYWFGAYSSAGGSILSGLVRRRMAEANLFINGQYGTSRPSNYCYVKLNPNGGDVESRVNAYNIDTNDRITTTPEREGYTFDGWYTAEDGGTLVTKLNKDVNGDTLYARWSGGPVKEEPDEDDDSDILEDEITVTVTNNDVNLRKGPGTNYTTVGQANKGDKLSIAKVSANGSRLWGSSPVGWIALQYTNYEDVISGKAETPQEPEVTEPVPAEPAETQPEETEPAEDPIPGVVKVNTYLSVRKGPGTGYASVGKLYNGDKVIILEKKVVGALTWGRTEDGWISLKYVLLGVTELPEEPGKEPEAPVTPPAEEKPPVEEETPADSSLKGTVKVSSSLTIRTGPGTSYSVAGSLKNGTAVTITKQQTVGSVTWGYMGKGWVSMNYIVLAGQEPEDTPAQKPEVKPEPDETSITGTVKVSSVLTVREGPGSSYKAVGSLKNGTAITITKQQTVGTVTWGYMGKGWVSMKYVTVTSDSTPAPETPSEPSSPTGGNWGTVSASNGLSIRQGPGTSYAIKGYYDQGDRVEILNTQKVGSVTWGKTSKGWICLQYVALDNAQAPKDTRIVDTSCLTVRSGAGTGYKAVDYLYRGTEVEILDTKTVKGLEWGRIESGWICLKYTK